MKIVSIVFFLALVFIALIPLKVQSCRKNHNFLSILNAFAGGVFLSMALVHI